MVSVALVCRRRRERGATRAQTSDGGANGRDPCIAICGAVGEQQQRATLRVDNERVMNKVGIFERDDRRHIGQVEEQDERKRCAALRRPRNEQQIIEQEEIVRFARRLLRRLVPNTAFANKSTVAAKANDDLIIIIIIITIWIAKSANR